MWAFNFEYFKIRKFTSLSLNSLYELGTELYVYRHFSRLRLVADKIATVIINGS